MKGPDDTKGSLIRLFCGKMRRVNISNPMIYRYPHVGSEKKKVFLVDFQNIKGLYPEHR